MSSTLIAVQGFGARAIQAEIDALTATITAQQQRIADLQAQLGQGGNTTGGSGNGIYAGILMQQDAEIARLDAADELIIQTNNAMMLAFVASHRGEQVSLQ